jgi:hypothetical protein
MTTEREKIADALFSDVRENESLYAILDAARNIEIAYKVQNTPNLEYVSLYRGRKEEPYWDAAPYLVRCNRESEFFSWVIKNGWRDSWGIFLTSSANFQDLIKHFQELLIVKLEDGREVYFRFYDPRVLRIFVSTCSSAESIQLFGPVSSYLLEEQKAETLLRFINSSHGTK